MARRLSALSSALGQALGGALRATTYAWRRSVQARVVISTLVLGSLVVALVGWLLLRSVAEGLVKDKAEASVAQAEAGFREARLELASGVLSAGAAESEALTGLVETLANRGGSARTYEVVLTGPLDQAAGGIGRGSRTSPEVDSSSVPANLRDDVESAAGTYWTYTELAYQTDRPAEPAVAVGSQLQVPSTGEVYALYYLFPMGEQEQTLSLLARSLAIAAMALLVLVAGVAWLVTRQVVTPVRLAARIAERLAAGRLEERVHVVGEDDIARLGVSFNQMAASLQKKIREFEELSRLQRRFVSDVSHELRTPLTTVRMAADVLHDAKHRFDPATARSAELLQAELDRFEALLADLLEISRFDAGAAGLELETIDLREVAERVVASSQPLADMASVRLSVVDAGSSGGCLVEADVRRIERVVRNLVGNAISYSESDDVELRLASDETAVALAVRDFGIGLQPGEETLVFNRFWRSDPSRVRVSGGTGLGLAISREDAVLHGGRLEAWGEPGRGSQFLLTLPRRVGEPLRGSTLPLVPRDPVPLPAARGLLPRPGPTVVSRR
jgi:two-component system sensor histidine kinase MtrB